MIFGSAASEDPPKLAKKISHFDFTGRHTEFILIILQAEVPNSPFGENDPDYILASFDFSHAAKSSESTLIGHAVAFALRPVTAFLVLIPPEVALKVEGTAAAVC
ncbi:hypothetical protein ABZ915_07770 [Streptomyces sp. NPDC046915]|uniref:hypothetical protein n=1 Tax=Streptomyces sp. NPDC046915 TaxID=3155257 RepID=UPI0033D5D638